MYYLLNSIGQIHGILYLYLFIKLFISRGRRGIDRMVVGLQQQVQSVSIITKVVS